MTTNTNTNPNRTVSQRDTKAVIYAEVERLRALLEEREAQITLQAESIERLQTRVSNAKVVYLDMRAEIEELKAKSEEQVLLASDAKEIARRCSVLLKRSTRVRSDGVVEQYKDEQWVAVPKRVLHYASK